MLSLRPYQQQMIDETRAHFKALRKRVLLTLPTGGGKTALASRMLHGARDKGKRVWFCVHRRELIRQVSEAFAREGLAHSIVGADWPTDRHAMAQICSIPALAKRYKTLPPPDMIVWDECHHLASKSWSALCKAFPSAYHVGLSATPARLDGRGLADYFDQMVRGPTVAELIEQKYLSRYRLFAPSTVDTSGLHRRMGDFVTAESEALMNKPKITGDAISHYRKHCDGARAIVFCASIDHSRAVSKQFNEAGIPSLHIDGKSAMRDEMVDDFKAGKVRILCNVDLFGEGFDLPAIEAAILLRPTMSLTLYMQQVGRALRPYPGKEQAIILDHVGNSVLHGLPDDDREWTLTGDVVKASKKNEVPAPRICPKCFGASRSGSQRCSICGEPFPVEAREIVQVDGELAEIEVARQRREARVQQAKADSLEGLRELAKLRGYNERWAEHVYAARQAKKQKRANA